MTETSSRLLTLLSLLQARRDWPGGELADRLEVSGRTIRRDVERLRELGYPVESLHRPGGRLPAARGHGDAAAAARRRRGDRDRGRAADRRPRVGDGIEETSVRALVKLEQVLPGAPAPPRPRARRGDDRRSRPAGRRSTRRRLTRDRRRLPRLRARPLRLPRPRRGRDPPRGRAALARQPRPPLVPRSPGTAAARTGAPSASTGSQARPRPACASRRASCRPRTRRAYVASSISAAPQPLRGAGDAARAGGDACASALPLAWGTIEPIDERTCEYRTGDDDLDWLALRIAMLGVDFEVHEPPELVEHLRRAGAAGRAGGRVRPGGADSAQACWPVQSYFSLQKSAPQDLNQPSKLTLSPWSSTRNLPLSSLSL